MQKIAVVLSGNGVFDGAEIHEATLTLYAIAKKGAAYEIFAPDIPQHHVINHITGEEMDETRNVLIESARIARGNIRALSDFSGKDFDSTTKYISAGGTYLKPDYLMVVVLFFGQRGRLARLYFHRLLRRSRASSSERRNFRGVNLSQHGIRSSWLGDIFYIISSLTRVAALAAFTLSKVRIAWAI